MYRISVLVSVFDAIDRPAVLRVQMLQKVEVLPKRKGLLSRIVCEICKLKFVDCMSVLQQE